MIASLTSCDVISSVVDLFYEPEMSYPEGYTGGTRYFYPDNNEYYWLESLDEAKDAIERLESNGSMVLKGIAFDCPEAYGFDVKYLITIPKEKTSRLRKGKNPFDRKAEDVSVKWFLFDEYIPIDELVYLYAEEINCLSYRRMVDHESYETVFEDPNLLSVDHGIPEYGLDWPNDKTPPATYIIRYAGAPIADLGIGEKGVMLPKEYALEMVKGITWLGNTTPKASWSPLITSIEYCVETYSELLDALEVLRAYGNDIEKSVVFDCEGMSFDHTILDCKYFIYLEDFHAEEPTENILEHKYDEVRVEWRVYDRFYPLYHGVGSRMDRFDINKNIMTASFAGYKIEEISDPELLNIHYYGVDDLNWPEHLTFPPYLYGIDYDGKLFCEINLDTTRFPEYEDYPPAEFAIEFGKTVRIIN